MKSLSYLLPLAMVLGLANCAHPRCPQGLRLRRQCRRQNLVDPQRPEPTLPHLRQASTKSTTCSTSRMAGPTSLTSGPPWCRPCLTEMPFFEQLAKETADKDLQVIMISLDRPGDVRTKLKDFFNDRPMTLPVVALTDDDFRSWVRRVNAGWTTGSIPVTLIYRNGLRKFNRGQISSYAELRAW